MKKSLKITLIVVIALAVIILGGFYVYASDYYKATTPLIPSSQTVNNQQIGDMTVFYPEKSSDINTGVIFYPGGKVEAIAYAPLLNGLSQKGFTCVLIEMPYNLAVFDADAADKAYEILPEIDNWYIAGHSLGGAMASSYAEENNDILQGLILLGAYPADDIDIPILTIYGSEDNVLDKSKLIETDAMLEIEGGNHAYFGNYGEQKGDGTAAITREEQQAQTIDAIVNFIRNLQSID